MFTICRKDGLGERLTVSPLDLISACEKLSEGQIHPLDIAPVPSEPVAMAEPIYSTFAAQVTDDGAKARIERQHASLASSGVTVDTTQQFFATGTRMAADGYARQNDRKVEHDKAMTLRDASAALRAAVESEGRTDRVVTARELAGALTVNGKVSAFGLAFGEQAIRGLAVRLDSRRESSSGMLTYALGLRNRIAEESAKGEKGDLAAMHADKAHLAEILQHECARAGDIPLKLRTREGVGDVFAIVSPDYTPADAPALLDTIDRGMPRDAKGTWSYDPSTTAWELRASVWTPTPVAEQAVGEAFEGYVSFRSKDAGNGSLNSGGGISLLRCLNASTYTAGETSKRTHRSRILVNVDRMLRESLKAIDALCKAWGVARETALDVPSGVTIEQAIPGFWRYCLTARGSELAGVLPGRTEHHVKALTSAFHAERRTPSAAPVKADLAQGWTRYIQAQPADVRRDAESAVGAWIASVAAPIGCDLRA